MSPTFITQAEAAEMLRVSQKTIERFRKRGELAYQRVGNSIRYRAEHVLALASPEKTAPSTGANRSWEHTRQSDADLDLPPMAMLRPARRAA